MTTDVTDDRMTPPWYWRVAYRVFERRLPEEYSAWVVADVSSRGWPLRITLTRYLNTLVLVVLIQLVLRMAAGTWNRPMLIAFGLLLLLLPVEYVRALRRPVTVRKEVLDRHGIDREGRPLGPDVVRNRVAQVFQRVRNRLIPRREFEALLYAVAMVLVLDGTAAIGFNMRGDEPAPPVKTVKAKGCVPVPDQVRDAIIATIPTKNAAMGTHGAVRFEDGIVVAAFFTPDPNPEDGHGTAVFFVTAEGRGYRVRMSSIPPSGVKSRAGKIDLTNEYDTPRAKAVWGAFACLTEKTSKRK